MIPSWCETAMSQAALVPCGERTHDEERELVRRSGAVVAADPAGFAAAFYARLFARQPEMRLLFPPQHEVLGLKFSAMLVQLLETLDRPQELGQALQELGRRHRGYGAKFSHYLAMGEALIETLAERNGVAFDGRARLAWARLVSWVVYRMRHAATEPRRDPPLLRTRAAPGAITAEIG
jgi:hemoglobin-like flavoprotein